MKKTFLLSLIFFCLTIFLTKSQEGNYPSFSEEDETKWRQNIKAEWGIVSAESSDASTPKDAESIGESEHNIAGDQLTRVTIYCGKGADGRRAFSDAFFAVVTENTFQGSRSWSQKTKKSTMDRGYEIFTGFKTDKKFVVLVKGRYVHDTSNKWSYKLKSEGKHNHIIGHLKEGVSGIRGNKDWRRKCNMKYVYTHRAMDAVAVKNLKKNIKRVSKERDSYNEEVKKLKNKILEFDKKIASLNSEIKNEKNKSSNLEKKIKDITDDKNLIEKKLTLSKEKIELGEKEQRKIEEKLKKQEKQQKIVEEKIKKHEQKQKKLEEENIKQEESKKIPEDNLKEQEEKRKIIEKKLKEQEKQKKEAEEKLKKRQEDLKISEEQRILQELKKKIEEEKKKIQELNKKTE